jgi:hypothetical protein
MDESNKRIIHLKGTPREIGLAKGRLLGQRLENNIRRYIQDRPQNNDALDHVRVQNEALPLLRKLPLRFQEELEGLAEGSGVNLQRVAEWIAVERCVLDSCSGLILLVDRHSWVGRNNDFRVPDAWGYVTIREVDNRIPTISFGMEGDVFSGTGINYEQLWIHSQFLQVEDTPRADKPHYPGYVILTEALETCQTPSDVEDMLNSIDRDDGVIFFVVDGKTNESVIFECTCQQYISREPVNDLLIATNHSYSTNPGDISENSMRRLKRLNELIDGKEFKEERLPRDIISILADALVEQRDGHYITVESAVACTTEKQIWYTLGGYPAASNGNWSRIEWPW